MGRISHLTSLALVPLSTLISTCISSTVCPHEPQGVLQDTKPDFSSKLVAMFERGGIPRIGYHVRLGRKVIRIMDTEVVIAGGGPVGLALANELAFRKVKCILVEKKASTTTLPKAFNITVRTMEHFRRLGVSEAIRDVSYPRDVPVCFTMYGSVMDRRDIFRKQFASWGEIADHNPGKEMLYFQSGCSVEIPMFCPQYEVEPVLKKKIDSSSYVTSYWGWEITSFDQDVTNPEGGVTIQIQTSGEDESEGAREVKTLKARYLVGCDGGKSPIRKALRIPLYGRFNFQHVLGIYFDCPAIVEPLKHRAGLNLIMGEDYLAFLIAFNPRKSTYMAQVILTSNQKDHIKNIMEDPKKVLHKIIGKAVDVKVIACYPWSAHALLAGNYREGNVLLCGDASHQWLPAGGLGMNTGLSDAADLAWKLEGALRGWGGPHLLDSYFLERYPIAENTLRYVTRFFGSARDNALFSFIFRKIVFKMPFLRSLAGRALGRTMVHAMQETTRVVLAFQYTNSNVIVHQPWDEVEPIPIQYLQDPFAPIALPGRRIPHIELPDFESIYDLLGETFVILIVNGEKEECSSLKQEADARGLNLDVVVLPPLSQVLLIFTKRYYLIRPDTIIAWCSDFQPNSNEAKEIMNIVTGMYPSERVPPEIVTPEMWSPQVKIPLVFSSAVSGAAVYVAQQFLSLPVSVSLLVGITLLGLLHGWTRPVYKPIVKEVSRHMAAIISKYGKPSDVLEINPRMVGSFGPKDVLIRVRAASVNPLDLRMCEGYGAAVFARLYRKLNSPTFPRVLGRDCAGEIVAVGDEVTSFLPGDEVYAAVPVSRQGSHSYFVAVPETSVALKPSNADFTGASSLPWVACTVWTALVKNAGLTAKNAPGKKVLVHGGSGGVGTFAIQLLKSWGASVTTTCSTKNVEFVQHIGADQVVDYTKENFVEVLPHDYDIVLDTIGISRGYEGPSLSVLKRFGGANYVSLVSPSFLFTSRLGSFLGGIVFMWVYRLKVILNRILSGRGFAYSACDAEQVCLDTIRPLVEKGQIRPIIDKVFSLEEVKDAFEHVSNGRPRGKVIIKMN